MQLTPLKAVRAKCVWCMNSMIYEVKNCTVSDCNLYPLRTGHGVPRGYSVLKATRRKCLDCSGSSNEVRTCDVNDCSLFVYRFGKRTKQVMTTA